MRKKVIDQEAQIHFTGDENWLDVKQLAQVEITSEDKDHPIEEIFSPAGKKGWRASKEGKQVIRIIFDEPQQIKKIYLLFEEDQQERTQEFLLQWSAGKDQPLQEIVRQQYNFSPNSSTREQEVYRVNLEGVKILELSLTPDINGGKSQGSISHLWLS